MLKTDRIAAWLFILFFALLTFSMTAVRYIDELFALSMLMLAVTDTIVNRGAWRRYKLLWLFLAVIAFFLGYSLFFCHYNIKRAVCLDAFLESKPFIVLFVMMALRPRFTTADKTLLKVIAVFNVAVSAMLLLTPRAIVSVTLGHVAFGGIYIFLSVLVYMLASIRPDGSITKHNMVVLVLLACAGLLCTRSKYYGEFVLLIFFLFVYRAGMFRRISIKQIATVGVLAAIIAVVAWKKFSYYFLYGGAAATSFDPEAIESFARPVLYATGLLILVDHFPFGTGLASFASYPSAEPYSGVYAEYGIDTVWGLSPSKPDFICDAYYPTLTQFGIAGVILFFWLWIYTGRLLGSLTRLNGAGNKYLYATGMLAIFFVLIESTSGTAMVNSAGVMDMAILGVIAGQACNARDRLRSEALTPTD